MWLVSRLRSILKKYKRELLYSLFTAGCLAIGYFLVKDRTIRVTLSTFKKLLKSEAVKEVFVKGEEIQFKTVLPELFHVNVSLLSVIEIKKLVGSLPITEMDDVSTFEKYKHAVYGMAALTSALAARLTLKTAQVIGKAILPKVKKLSNLKSKLVVKLNEIPKTIKMMKQVLMVNFANRLMINQISLRTNKKIVTISGQQLAKSNVLLTDSILHLEGFDLACPNNRQLFASLQRAIEGTNNIIIISGNSVADNLFCSQGIQSAKPTQLSFLTHSLPIQKGRNTINSRFLPKYAQSKLQTERLNY